MTLPLGEDAGARPGDTEPEVAATAAMYPAAIEPLGDLGETTDAPESF